MALPSWAAPRILIVSRSPLQRWGDSSAFYPALRLRAKIVKLGIRILVAFFPGLFVQRASRKCGKPRRGHRFASFLYRAFPSFKQSAIAHSLFPGFFAHIGTIDANAFRDCPAERGKLTDLISRYFAGVDRVVLISGAASDPKQKLVAQVLDRSGVNLGYLKFGEKPLARQRVENEAAILQALPVPCGPAFLELAEASGYSCFAMSAAEGEMMEAKLPESGDGCQLALVKEYLNQLKVSDELFSVDDHPAIIRLREQVAELGGRMSEARGQERVGCRPSSVISRQDFEEILVPLRSLKWPTVIQHGDFAPWNVLRTSAASSQALALSNENPATGKLEETKSPRPKTKGSLVAIDWEEGTTRGFPHFDLIYYVLQTAYFMHHWPADKAALYAQNTLTVNEFDAQQALSLIKLAALDAWLSGERGGLSGNPLQQFRLEIVQRSFP